MEFLGAARFCRGSPDSGLVELWNNLGLLILTKCVCAVMCVQSPVFVECVKRCLSLLYYLISDEL